MKNPINTRNAWPIGIIAYLGGGFIFIIAYTVFSMNQKMDHVREDYYDQELRFQQQIDRVSRTQAVKAEVVVSFDKARDSIALTLPQKALAGHVSLYRPSDASLDREVEIQTDDRGAQRIDAAALMPGLWKVRVQWMADGQEYFFDKAVVVTRG